MDSQDPWHAVRTPAAECPTISPRPAPLPYEPFPVGALPSVMSRFATEVARTLCVEPVLVALPMISVAGASIGNTVRARMNADYLAPAVVWTAPITRSGERKSPALRAVMRPILEAQAEAAGQHASTVASYKDDLERYRALAKKDRGDAPCEPPPYPHLYLSDVTAEAIALRLSEQPRGLIIVLDELSALFGSINQYKGGRGNDRESYLAFYDAGAAKVDRKASLPPTLFIQRAFVSITGMIQPGTLARCLKAAEYDSGMAARFLLAGPPPMKATWSDRAMADDVRNGWRDLVGSLLSHPLPETPALLPPSEAAMRLWAAAHDRLEADRHAEPDDRLRAARSKLIGVIPRVALILQMVSAASGEREAQVRALDELSMRRAIEIADWAVRETQRVYALLAEDGEDKNADDRGEDGIFRLIEERGGRITPRELARHRWALRTVSAATDYLESLVREGLGLWSWCQTRGRPSKVFVLTPRLNDSVGIDKSLSISAPSAGPIDKTPCGANGKGTFVVVDAVDGSKGQKVDSEGGTR